MKQYKVTVNNNVYEVTIETMGGSARPAAAPIPRRAAPVLTPAAAPAAPAPAPVAAPAAPAGAGTVVSAPMNGTICGIKVKEGQAVKNGELLFLLEAMKMENEIYAPCDGTVSSIAVSEGAAVNPGDVLCTIA